MSVIRSSRAKVSGGQFLVNHRKSTRYFKGIFWDDIPEFESYMASHAVWSRPLDSALSARGKDRIGHLFGGRRFWSWMRSRPGRSNRQERSWISPSGQPAAGHWPSSTSLMTSPIIKSRSAPLNFILKHDRGGTPSAPP